ncbi:MAG: hypothetical protein BWY74_01207 [Firmicutes bacterium ADurb.Bin419]|nr:MAG: hypothetical protein BWY74_01207 [Firmicutes bacterium ADurb.Bin419]
MKQFSKIKKKQIILYKWFIHMINASPLLQIFIKYLKHSIMRTIIR